MVSAESKYLPGCKYSSDAAMLHVLVKSKLDVWPWTMCVRLDRIMHRFGRVKQDEYKQSEGSEDSLIIWRGNT